MKFTCCFLRGLSVPSTPPSAPTLSPLNSATLNCLHTTKWKWERIVAIGSERLITYGNSSVCLQLTQTPWFETLEEKAWFSWTLLLTGNNVQSLDHVNRIGLACKRPWLSWLSSSLVWIISRYLPYPRTPTYYLCLLVLGW